MFRSMNIPPLARRALTFPIVLLAVLALGVSVATAANSIEGVWSFNGGAVGIQSLSDGGGLGSGLITFSDTVLLPNATAWRQPDLAKNQAPRSQVRPPHRGARQDQR